MTTDLRRALPALPLPALPLIALPLVALGWIGTLALVMRLGGEAPAALVILPPEGLIRSLPQGVSVVSAGPVSVTLRGGADLVTTLYALGAPLVLPAGLSGCLPQTG